MNIKQKLRAAHAKHEIPFKNISILSQNCMGDILYHDIGARFLSPTINLYFSANDFVKFVLNLPYYLNQELIVKEGENYPIGHLDDKQQPHSFDFNHELGCSLQ